MDIKVFIATHKRFNYHPIDGYYPIQLGVELSKENFGYLLDNDGDNISSKNKNYCELTAYYWIWKNINCDIVGLCHYRRYLCKKKKFKWKNVIQLNDITEDLSKYDIILPLPSTWPKHTCYEFYIQAEGKEKDLLAVRNIISENHKEYLPSFDIIMNGNSASYCNVLITSKKIFDSYCEWLFEILFQLEKSIDLSNYTTAEARVFGYLSELLLNVWVHHHNLNIKYYNLVNTEETNFILRKIKKILQS